MKKSVKFCLIACGILVLGFSLTCLLDAVRNNSDVNSAPYWAFVAARAIEFLIPALFFLIAAVVCYFKKPKKDSGQ